jgi:hypothetical protein
VITPPVDSMSKLLTEQRLQPCAISTTQLGH